MSLYDSGVRPQIDSWLLAKSKEVRDYGDYWSASSAGYCMRKVIFERLGVPKIESDDDGRLQRVFTSGHLFHDWVQGITKKAGLSIASEVELQDEDLMIRGHFDDLVLVNNYETINDTDTERTDMLSQHLILYDYKTVNSRSFNYKKDEMSHYHKMQLGTYMYMLRKKGQSELGEIKKQTDPIRTSSLLYSSLTEARTLLISKDDLRMKEQQLLWSPDIESKVLNYWNTLNTHWKNKTLPKCTCGDHEKNSKTGVGFMADPRYNPYFYEGEPCSIKYYEKWKKDKSDG